MKKIGFFQKWNKEAGVPEFSMTRLLQILILIYVFFFDFHYVNLILKSGQDVVISLNFIFLNIVFLIAVFFPKYLKDLIDLKNKL